MQKTATIAAAHSIYSQSGRLCCRLSSLHTSPTDEFDLIGFKMNSFALVVVDVARPEDNSSAIPFDGQK